MYGSVPSTFTENLRLNKRSMYVYFMIMCFVLLACTIYTIQKLLSRNPMAIYGPTKFTREWREISTLKSKYIKRRSVVVFPEQLTSSNMFNIDESLLEENFNPNVHFLTHDLLNFHKTIPNEFDWGSLGGLTPIKDQGILGSCFAHVAASNVETAHWMKHNELHRVSVQHSLDCFYVDKCDDKNICCFEDDCSYFGPVDAFGDGGFPGAVARFWSHKGYIHSHDYPYLYAGCSEHQSQGLCNAFDFCHWEDADEVCANVQHSSCHLPAAMATFGKVKRVFRVSINTNLDYPDTKPLRGTDVPSMDEERMKAALYQLGPLSALIDGRVMFHYQSGIIDLGPEDCSQTFENHVVQIVGFGTEDGVDYWKIRNSHGTDWGEDGYMRFKRGSNVCGVANFVEAIEVV